MQASESPSRQQAQPRAKPPPLIVRFYDPDFVDKNGNRQTDPEGRTLNEILAFTDPQLEIHHDFIQILFPLPEESPFNPYAACVTREVRDAFAEREELRQNLSHALKRMLNFYAFQLDYSPSTNSVDVAPLAPALHRRRRDATWGMSRNHNHLRISRVIRSCRILGLAAEADAFFNALEKAGAPRLVSRTTWMFWERAAKRPLHLAPDESDDNAEGVTWLRDDHKDQNRSSRNV